MLNWLEALSEWLGRAVAWLTVAMVLVTVGIVVARYGFGGGSIAVQESVLYMHALVFLVGAGYTLKHDKHVRVDIFYQAMSPRRRALVDLLGSLLLLLPVCGFIFWISLDFVAASWSMNRGQGEASAEAGGLPYVYLLKTLIPVAAALLALQGLAAAGRSWQRLRRSGADD